MSILPLDMKSYYTVLVSLFFSYHTGAVIAILNLGHGVVLLWHQTLVVIVATPDCFGRDNRDRDGFQGCGQ